VKRPSICFVRSTKYRFCPPDAAAYLSTVAEHLLSVLLLFGLPSRLSARGLFGMTMVIQLFVVLLTYYCPRPRRDLALPPDMEWPAVDPSNRAPCSSLNHSRNKPQPFRVARPLWLEVRYLFAIGSREEL